MSTDDRFARFALIDWWEQARLSAAKVVVVGAGALGNELIKNCALLGIGNLVIIDFDRVETSNLSRSVLFRAADAGAAKAEAAARGGRDIYPGMQATALCANVVHDVGLGLFRWADLVLGGLDNREARLTINRACYRVGTPWVDGAIEALSGVARVFLPPDGPCYECTMSDADFQLLEQRRSCSLLSRELHEFGKVATTPTTASVIAGIACQEALKLLHERPGLSGSGFVFDGVNHGSYLVAYQRKPECMSHDPIEEMATLEARADGLRAGEALKEVRRRLGERAHLEFSRELLLALDCAECGESERLFRPLSAVSEADGQCRRCGGRRAPQLFHRLTGSEDFLGKTLAELGVPAWDIFTGVLGERRIGFELAGDRRGVLGAAAD